MSKENQKQWVKFKLEKCPWRLLSATVAQVLTRAEYARDVAASDRGWHDQDHHGRLPVSRSLPAYRNSIREVAKTAEGAALAEKNSRDTGETRRNEDLRVANGIAQSSMYRRPPMERNCCDIASVTNGMKEKK
ncbi:hypothetical protein KM043_013513 [Ampulex compressa]|nr:hypothetical protein KM043_013513 [Ampulex compressa]